jgi:YD repeat-containing protein
MKKKISNYNLSRTVRNVLIVLMCLNFSFLEAQDGEYVKNFVQNIVPPSPTAFEFATAGNIPLSGSTGGFSYSVPIYTVTSGDISVPISLNYYSNGVHVDNLSGIVGTDWSLNAGGAVSRVMKDLPDELGTRWYPANPDIATDGVTLRKLAQTAGFDGEPDWFSFSANGLSGTFFFDENLQPHITCDEHVQISYTLLTTPFKRLQDFTIIDEKGFKYIFGGSDDYIERNTSYSECSPETITYDSSWFLKEIISPKGNSVTFTYELNSLLYKSNYSSTISVMGKCPLPMVSQNTSVNTCISYSSMQSKVLAGISFKNNTVIFSYDAQRLDGGGKLLKGVKVTANAQVIKQVALAYDIVGGPAPANPFLADASLYYRTFLKEVAARGSFTLDTPQKYTFAYFQKEQLPIRLSFSKDYYGFHNGSNNATAFSNRILNTAAAAFIAPGLTTANLEVNPNVLHYGMLQKITYPTGGYTAVTYEPNKDITTADVPVESQYTINVIKYCDSSTSPVTGTYEFVANGSPINIEAFANIQGQPCTVGSTTDNNYNVKVYKDNVLILNQPVPYGTHLDSDPTKPCQSSFTAGAYVDKPICTVNGSTYKVTITLNKTGVYGTIKIKYNAAMNTVQTTVYGGGCRTTTIEDYTDSKGYNKRTFYYNKLADYLSTNTTMSTVYEPVFYYNIPNYIVGCPDGLTDEGNISITPRAAVNFSVGSSSYTSSYFSRGQACYSAITEVFEKDGEKNGAVEQVFNLAVSTPGQVTNGYDLYSVPASNYGQFTANKIAEENVYDSQNTPVSSKIYHYNFLQADFIPSTIVRRNFSVPGEADYDSSFGGGIAFANFSNFSMWQYKNYFGVIKVDKITETTYYGNGNLGSITDNTFGPQPFYQLKSTTTTSSTGVVIKEEYSYPSDLIGVEQAPYMQQLATAHRIADPVIIKGYKSGIKLSEKHIKYGNSAATSGVLLPIEVHTKKGTAAIDVATVSDRKLEFLQYDSKGNILEYRSDGGTSVSIIWGYSQEYPIAKVEGATYTQLSGYAGTLMTASNNGSLTASSFNSLRTGLTTAMVSTYTYLPLTGMTTSTDPKGMTTSYKYDTFGRLQSVKDRNGNLISENAYHLNP